MEQHIRCLSFSSPDLEGPNLSVRHLSPTSEGRGRGHKGQRRHFTSPEEIAAQQKDPNWKRRGDGDEDEEDDDPEGTGSSDESSEDEGNARKGVSALIEIENPNRVHRKANKNLTLESAGGSSTSTRNGPAKDDGTNADGEPLSRREREELEKQRAREAYQRLHAQGKTDQARADLARLAIIKQQREDAQKRREADQKAREVEVKAKQSLTNKALGKK
ncbi:unnamed protein product [Oppiella nova]|uniref:Casein kinase substrate phosphoprotein PP28 domain-containing protein n=1 Tax=Oppiella nova TaxID=334625 RepID=A0A7R9QMS8_9ACAR|nr:unnamed protein product [Oppiella nova]CAG2168906.1 unnamed protein product [Oppiella nova]